MSTMKLRPPAGRVRGDAPPPDPIVAATAPVYAAELRAAAQEVRASTAADRRRPASNKVTQAQLDREDGV